MTPYRYELPRPTPTTSADRELTAYLHDEFPEDGGRWVLEEEAKHRGLFERLSRRARPSRAGPSG